MGRFCHQREENFWGKVEIAPPEKKTASRRKLRKAVTVQTLT